MNSVIHFEIPAENRTRAAEFYATAFGWDTKQLGPEMGNYITVDTIESDEKGPLKPGAINGGIYQKSSDNPGKHPSLVMNVNDLEAHMKKVEEAGGKIITEPMNIPGVGKFVSFLDTEGNQMSMLQPDM